MLKFKEHIIYHGSLFKTKVLIFVTPRDGFHYVRNIKSDPHNYLNFLTQS